MEGIILSVFGVIVTLSGVLCEEIGDINGIVAASVVGFFMLCIVIAMIIVGIYWDKWFSKYQRWRGKIKIPRHIIEQRKKRRQAEKTLSEKSLVANGNGRMPTGEPDSKSWVEGWNGKREYEEKVNTIDLEPEEEYRIEAEIVDNEALDLGPYKKQSDMPNTLVTSVTDQRSDPTVQSEQLRQSGKPQEGPQDSQKPLEDLYSVVDRASQKSKVNGAARHTYEETETSFSDLTSDPNVVIM